MKHIEKLAQKKLEDILLDGGYVDRSVLEQCFQKSHASSQPLGEVLLKEGAIEEEQLARVLCSRLQLPFLALKNHKANPELIQRYPPNILWKYQFIPLDQFGEVLTILVAGVLTQEMIEEIQVVTQSELYVFIGKISDVTKTLEEYISEEHHTEISTEVSTQPDDQVTAGWESIFDMADMSVKEELSQKAEEAGVLDVGEESSEFGEESSEFEDLVHSTASQFEVGNQTAIGIGEEEDEEEEEEGDELAELEAHLADNPYDYDTINQYVEIALNMGHVEAAVAQLLSFANGLDDADRHDEAVNCYEYVLELDPENEEAQQRLQK